MDMLLTESQRMLQEALRRFLQEHLPLDCLRRIEAGTAPEAGASLWRGLAELGVPGLMVPEPYGGSGLGLLEAGLAAEQIGRASAPLPFAGSVVMAARALLQSGDEARRRWLPALTQGRLRIAVGFAAALSGQTGAGTLTMDKGRLSGRVDAVLDAEGADWLLLYPADGRAVMVEAARARIETRRSVDALRPISSVALHDAPAEPLPADDPPAAAREVLDAGRLALAFDTLGAAQTMLDHAVAYAKEREQFGRPIGSFQGVKYLCAEMVTQLEPCRALLWQAARLAGSDAPGARLAGSGAPQARLAALHAKAHLADVAREVSRMAIEVHGGVGFTDLLGMPFWFRRIALNRQLLGSPQRCREEAAALQGWA